MHTHFRAAAPFAIEENRLGPLVNLAGTWIGKGFNLIALPDKENQRPFRVMLSSTIEVLSFALIGGPIPNRGSAQGDIESFGLHYLQQVSDGETHAALHLEPGLWLNVPATTAPEGPASIVRQSTIPHGNSVLAQGRGFNVDGGPVIDPVSSKPTRNDGQPFPLGYTDPYLNIRLPPGIQPGYVENPNAMLKDAILDQRIVSTTVIEVSTTSVGGILNIPFIQKNADLTKLDAVFWVETIEKSDGSKFLQLQYTQTVVLDFLGIAWPHISVATLIKQ